MAGLTPGVATCRLKAALASVKQWRKDWADTPARRCSPVGAGLLPAPDHPGEQPRTPSHPGAHPSHGWGSSPSPPGPLRGAVSPA